MICSDIQKDLAACCAMKVTKVIKDAIGDKKFSILIDEARDCSIKEQMAVIVRYCIPCFVLFYSLLVVY